MRNLLFVPVVFTLCCISCQSNKEDPKHVEEATIVEKNPIINKWKVIDLLVEEEITDTILLAVLDISSKDIFYFNEDSTCSIITLLGEITGKWETKGDQLSIQVDDESLKAYFIDSLGNEALILSSYIPYNGRKMLITQKLVPLSKQIVE